VSLYRLWAKEISSHAERVLVLKYEDMHKDPAQVRKRRDERVERKEKRKERGGRDGRHERRTERRENGKKNVDGSPFSRPDKALILFLGADEGVRVHAS
jgi:hypothetical protein